MCLALVLSLMRTTYFWRSSRVAVATYATLALAGCMGSVGGPGAGGGTGGDPTLHASRATPAGSTTDAMPVEEHEVLVRFAGGVLVDGAPPADFLGTHLLGVRRCSANFDACGLRFDGSRSLTDVLFELRADPRVASASPMILAEAATAAGADLSALQWNLDALETRDATSPADGNLGETVVALLDTGVLPVAGLAGVPLVDPYDFVNDDTDASDDHFHGTHLAGVISDATPGVGTDAVSPGLAIMPVKVLDATALGNELDLADGIAWAVDHGATVINMSLAFPAGFYPSKLLQEAVGYATKNGVIMVAAAGNGGRDGVVYPAAFRDVIAVGASKVDPTAVPGGATGWDWLDAGGLVAAPYSNTGGMLDVLAPGGVLNEDLNGDGYADGILAETFAPGNPSAPGFWILAGTSHAAAHVSSLAARMLANCPTLTADQLRAWLAEDAVRDGDLFDPTRGFGFLRGGEALSNSFNSSSVPSVKDFYAGVMVTLHDAPGGGIEAHARVEVLKWNFHKAPIVTVVGSWIGAATGTVTGETDSSGLISFTSSPLVAGGCAAGFQVEAIIQGAARAIHPRGFTNIELDSLNLLQANATLIGDTPAIVVFPTLFLPGIRSTITLANYGPDLATPPTSVAVDEGCYASNFPMDAANALMASGQLVGDTPAIFDPATAFPFPVTAPAITFPNVAVRALTFHPGLGTNPLKVDLDAAYGPSGAMRASVQIALDRWFDYWVAGGSIPTKPGGNRLTDAQWAEAGNLVGGYLTFLAGDQDESVDNLADVVSVTAVALPTGTTATSAFVGAVEAP
jgi:hypothetical protein